MDDIISVLCNFTLACGFVYLSSKACAPHSKLFAQMDNLMGTKLLTCYLAAIIHDYDHRGVNNDFLVKTSDPLALLYNDFSPMESHHVAAAMTLMNEERFCFFARPNKIVGCYGYIIYFTSEV